MRFYADLHIHSKFARATSGEADLEHMALWAAKKGVTVLGTGDFTHPGWFTEIKEKLVPAEPGLFRLRSDLEPWVAQQLPVSCRQKTRYLLQVEISTIYKKGERTRKVHHCIYVPDLAAAERLIQRLSRIGNLNADGRPILGLDSRDLLEITLECGAGAFLIPAHIWTPWFAALGSKSGFDSIAECYGDLTRHIFALETGLSSDPPMNWRLAQLDRFHLVSNSDAHSPPKIGREACVFDCELDYGSIRRALETGQGYGGTIEFFPEEGKYHLDGHRHCGVCLEPEETREHGGRCPACGKELTVGVMHRVAELADRPAGARPAHAKPFRSLIPLDEVLAEIQRVGPGSRKVADAYARLVEDLGSELFILEHAPLDEVRRSASEVVAEALARMRDSRVIRRAGYDGEYGVIRLFTDDELSRDSSVSLLFDLPASGTRDGLARATPSPAAKPELGRASPPQAAVTDEAEQPDRSRARVDAAVGTPTRREMTSRAETGPGGSWPSHGRPAPDLALAESAPPLPLAMDPIAGLDPEQRAAAEVAEGPLLIVAGPGTGKTRTLTHRIAHLVINRGVPAEHCLAVTFTNRAAGEMRERLRRLIPSAAAGLLVTTFHGLGHRLLREHGSRLGLPAAFRVASEPERLELLREQLKLSERKARQTLKRLSEWKRTASHSPLSAVTSGLDAAPRDLGHGEASATEPEQLLRAAHDRALRERGWLDFDDLVRRTVELLEAHSDLRDHYQGRFHHVSVDEFQDIDVGQYRLVQLLVPPHGNLCVIGDPDQAIYGFRGTDVRFFQQLTRDYPNTRTVHLRRNYRSSRTIVEGALQAIAPATRVEGRVLEALNADATRITIHESPTDKAEAEFVVHTIERLIGGHGFFSLDSRRVEAGETRSDYSFADFAVLYRTDAQAGAFGEALARSGIPFQRHSHSPLAAHPGVQALRDAARTLVAQGTVRERLQAALPRLAAESVPREADGDQRADSALGTSDSDLGFVRDFVLRISDLASHCGNDFARFESELALLSDADLWDAQADGVSLLTLHASKGLEFPVVFVTGCEDGLLPLRLGWDQTDNLDEERRLFFVGMTRARDRLFLSHAGKRFWRGQLRAQAVSPFVTAIRRELLERSQARLKPRERPAAEQLDLFARG